MAGVKPAKLSGRKIKPPRLTYCTKGHEVFRYLFAPVMGRRKFLWACACTITPMATK